MDVSQLRKELHLGLIASGELSDLKFANLFSNGRNAFENEKTLTQATHNSENPSVTAKKLHEFKKILLPIIILIDKYCSTDELRESDIPGIDDETIKKLNQIIGEQFIVLFITQEAELVSEETISQLNNIIDPLMPAQTVSQNNKANVKKSIASFTENQLNIAKELIILHKIEGKLNQPINDGINVIQKVSNFKKIKSLLNASKSRQTNNQPDVEAIKKEISIRKEMLINAFKIKDNDEFPKYDGFPNLQNLIDEEKNNTITADAIIVKAREISVSGYRNTNSNAPNLDPSIPESPTNTPSYGASSSSEPSSSASSSSSSSSSSGSSSDRRNKLLNNNTIISNKVKYEPSAIVPNKQDSAETPNQPPASNEIIASFDIASPEVTENNTTIPAQHSPIDFDADDDKQTHNPQNLPKGKGPMKPANSEDVYRTITSSAAASEESTRSQTKDQLTPQGAMALEISMLEYFIVAQNKAIFQMSEKLNESNIKDKNLVNAVRISSNMITEANKRISDLRKDIENGTSNAKPLSDQFLSYLEIPTDSANDNKVRHEVWTSRYFYHIKMVDLINENKYIFGNFATIKHRENQLNIYYNLSTQRYYARDLAPALQPTVIPRDARKIILSQNEIIEFNKNAERIKASAPRKPESFSKINTKSILKIIPRYFSPKKPNIVSVTQEDNLNQDSNVSDSSKDDSVSETESSTKSDFEIKCDAFVEYIKNLYTNYENPDYYSDNEDVINDIKFCNMIGDMDKNSLSVNLETFFTLIIELKTLINQNNGIHEDETNKLIIIDRDISKIIFEPSLSEELINRHIIKIQKAIQLYNTEIADKEQLEKELKADNLADISTSNTDDYDKAKAYIEELLTEYSLKPNKSDENNILMSEYKENLINFQMQEKRLLTLLGDEGIEKYKDLERTHIIPILTMLANNPEENKVKKLYLELVSNAATFIERKNTEQLAKGGGLEAVVPSNKKPQTKVELEKQKQQLLMKQADDYKRKKESQDRLVDLNIRTAKPLEIDMLNRFIKAHQAAILAMKADNPTFSFAGMYAKAIAKSGKLIVSAQKRIDILNSDISNRTRLSESPDNSLDSSVSDFIECNIPETKEKTHLCFYYYHNALVKQLKLDTTVSKEFINFIPDDIKEHSFDKPETVQISAIISANHDNKAKIPDYIMNINRNVDHSNPVNSFTHLSSDYLITLRDRAIIDKVVAPQRRSLRKAVMHTASKAYAHASPEHRLQEELKEDLAQAMESVENLVKATMLVNRNPIYLLLFLARQNVKHGDLSFHKSLENDCKTFLAFTKEFAGHVDKRKELVVKIENTIVYAFYLLARNKREAKDLPDDHLFKHQIRDLEQILTNFVLKNFADKKLSGYETVTFNAQVKNFNQHIAPLVLEMMKPMSERLVAQSQQIEEHNKAIDAKKLQQKSRTIEHIKYEIMSLTKLIDIYTRGLTYNYQKVNKAYIDDILKRANLRLTFLQKLIAKDPAQAIAEYTTLDEKLKSLLDVQVYASNLLASSVVNDIFLRSETKRAEIVSLALYCISVYRSNEQDVDFTKINNEVRALIDILNDSLSLTSEQITTLRHNIPILLSFFSAMKSDPALLQRARQVDALYYAQSLKNPVVNLDQVNNDIENILTSKPAADVLKSLNDAQIGLNNLDEHLKDMPHQLVPTLRLAQAKEILEFADENLNLPQLDISKALIAINRLQAHALQGSDPELSSDDIFKLRTHVNDLYAAYNNLIIASNEIKRLSGLMQESLDSTVHAQALAKATMDYNAISKGDFTKYTLLLNAVLNRLFTVVKILPLNHDQAVLQRKSLEKNEALAAGVLKGMEMVLPDNTNPVIVKLKTIHDSYSTLQQKASRQLEAKEVKDYSDLGNEMQGIRETMSWKEQSIISAIVMGASRLNKLSVDIGTVEDAIRPFYTENMTKLKSALSQMSLHYAAYLKLSSNNKPIADEELTKAYQCIPNIEKYSDESYLQSLINARKVQKVAPAAAPVALAPAPSNSAPRNFKLPALPSVRLPSITPNWDDPKWDRLFGKRQPKADMQFEFTGSGITGSGIDDGDEEDDFSDTHSHVSSDASDLDDYEPDVFVHTVVEKESYVNKDQPIANKGDVIAEVNIPEQTIGKILTFYAPQDDEMREQARAMVSAAINHGKEIPLYIAGPNKALCEAIIKVCIASDIQFSTEDDFGDNLVIGDFHAMGNKDTDGYTVYQPIKPIAKPNFVGSQGMDYAVETSVSTDVIKNNIQQTVAAAKGSQQKVNVNKITQITQRL